MNDPMDRLTAETRAKLEALPPEARERALAAIASIQATLARFAPEALAKLGPPFGSAAEHFISAEPVPAEPPPSHQPAAGWREAWKGPAFLHVASECLKNVAALDRAILPLLKLGPRSQRQTARDIEALREAWQLSMGGRRAYIKMLDRIIRAQSADELKSPT